jgi:N-formylglutamate deformylase
MSEIYRHLPGNSPLLVSVPHCGIQIPDHIAARMTPAALALADTDWHVDKLYDFAGGLGAHMLLANYSRYVVDLNRDPEGKPLYPQQENTGVVPVDSFDRLPLYRPGEEPKEQELRRRLDVYWRPYHDRIQHELERLKDKYGFAVIFDAHSIRSHLPRFFKGQLTDYNLGTANGASMDTELAGRLLKICEDDKDHASVLNGRFTGGYITRRYGRPAEGVQAVQLELSQIVYMDERPPFRYHAELAEKIQPTLRRVLEALLAWGRTKAR